MAKPEEYIRSSDLRGFCHSAGVCFLILSFPSFPLHFLRDQEYEQDLLSLLQDGQNCDLNWYKMIQSKGMGTGHNQISFSYKLIHEAHTLLSVPFRPPAQFFLL